MGDPSLRQPGSRASKASRSLAAEGIPSLGSSVVRQKRAVAAGGVVVVEVVAAVGTGSSSERGTGSGSPVTDIALVVMMPARSHSFVLVVSFLKEHICSVLTQKSSEEAGHGSFWGPRPGWRALRFRGY